MIYLLLVMLIIMLVITFIISKKDIISPAFIFTFGFTFQAIWAAIYANQWGLNLNVNTFFVIFLGVLEFIIVSFLVSKLYKRKKQKIVENDLEKEANTEITKINVNKKVEVIVLCICVIISIAFLFTVVKLVDGSFDSFKTISESLAKYDSMSKFSENTIRIPFLISNLEIFVVAVGYWFSYVLINNFFVEKKLDYIKIAIVIISLISSTFDGSRGNAFMIIASMIFFFLYFLSKKKNYTNVVSKKLVRNILIIGFVFLVSFSSLANLLGRNITGNKMDYLAIYCGAEVKNLDIYLQEDQGEKNSIIGSQTFVNLITSFGEKIGFDGYKSYKLDLPFREYNGFNLGNVYTTFYPFIYDFGYVGEFVLVLIMALIAQLIYERIKSTNKSNGVSILTLIYSIIFCCLALSFFSNKFYENIFTIGLLKYVAFWWLLNLALCKVDYKNLLKKIRRKK